MVPTNFNGFSLANCRQFAKFAKLSPRQTFSLYGMLIMQAADFCNAINLSATSYQYQFACV